MHRNPPVALSHIPTFIYFLATITPRPYNHQESRTAPRRAPEKDSSPALVLRPAFFDPLGARMPFPTRSCKPRPHPTAPPTLAAARTPRRPVLCSSALCGSVVYGSFLASLLGCGSALQPLSSTPVATPTPSPAAVQSGPQLGYIWSDTTHTLRPVLGIPGSSQLGQSVIPANLYTAAAASNLTSLALLQEADGTLDLMALPSGQPTHLAAAVPPGAQLRFAPSGLNAIAFVPGTATITLLATLLATPQITTLTLPQPVSDAAVSDAAAIAAALPSATGTSIRTLTPTGTSTRAASVPTLAGLAFAGTTDNLLVATADTLTLIHSSTSAPSPTLLPTAGLLKSPLGLGVSHDGRWAILANPTSVLRIDLTAQTAPRTLPCDCQPTLVAPLSGAAVFRLTSADAGPAWIVDAAAARVLFIPSSTPQKAGSTE